MTGNVPRCASGSTGFGAGERLPDRRTARSDSPVDRLEREFDRYRERKLKEDPAAYTTMNAVVFLVRVAMWSVIVLLVLANAGVEIAPLVAGLGVGGIAVALAVQTVAAERPRSTTAPSPSSSTSRSWWATS